MARVIPREQHGISRKNISPNALRVLYRQLREQMIADDWAAIEALLPEVL